MKDKKLEYNIGALFNVRLNQLGIIKDQMSLYKHWLMNFDKMDYIYQKRVIVDICNEIQELGLDTSIIDELLVQYIKPEDMDMMKSMIKEKESKSI